MLFWLMIEHFHHRKIALFDFGIGDQTYKRSWCPVETVQHDAILAISALGRAAAIAKRSATRAKAVIKSNPQIYSWIQRLRAQTGDRPIADDAADKD
jgi:CelD/BcsL family acetyltransferase involved in cellulose biosynthesis